MRVGRQAGIITQLEARRIEGPGQAKATHWLNQLHQQCGFAPGEPAILPREFRLEH